MIAVKLMELSLEYYSDDESTWALSGEEEIEKIRNFRHAAPESINMELETLSKKEKSIVKLSTDIIINNQPFREIINMYKNDAKEKGLTLAIFGHVKGNHVHVNILPRTYNEYLEGKNLIQKWLLYANKKGNTLFFEHGIGKIKKDLFKSCSKQSLLKEIEKKKNFYDPNNILNKGTVIDV
jgi:D-lactate dehydrogenase (cytochrome)